jgi:PAS domain S-box-containing protein
VEWLPVAVVMVDASATFVLANRAFAQLVGYSADEITAKAIDGLLPDAGRAIQAILRRDRDDEAPTRVTLGPRELSARRADGAEVPVEVAFTPIEFHGRRVVLASMSDLSQRRARQLALRKALDERIDFEVLVGELGAEFVNVNPNDVDRTIEGALGRLVRTLDVDRSALFELDEYSGDFVHTHQWTRPGWATPPPRVSARDQFPWHFQQVRTGELVSFGTIDEVPNPIDRESLRRIGTQSSITIPLIVSGRPWGALTFATLAEPRMWAADVVNRLRVVALTFANVLARKQADKIVQQTLAENAALRERLRDENTYLRHEVKALTGASAIVGNSPAFRRVLEQIRDVAVTDSTVLLLGETGTGKSLLAERLHDLSARRDRALVRVNCAALTVASIGDDLFGRDTRAAAESDTRPVGLLQLASGSTVFLDEVADLPADAQASLARVLQDRQIHPLGKGRPVAVDLRVIAASRRDLVASVQAGTFRDDLFYRLNVVPIRVPPLRERADDLPLLVWRFVDELCVTYGKTIDTIDQEAMTLLQQYPWPGNARELRNVVERAMIAATGRRLHITPPSVPKARRSETLAAVERAHIDAVLTATGGQIEGKHGAAARLGLTPRALAAKLRALGGRRSRR